MPTYEFHCPSGHDFEKFYRTISGGESAPACPVCGAAATRKLSAGAGLAFKGSGFYITDYGKDGKKSQNAPGKNNGGGDAKPAAASSSEGAKSDSSSSSSESKSPESKTSESKAAEPKPSAPKSSTGSE